MGMETKDYAGSGPLVYQLFLSGENYLLKRLLLFSFLACSTKKTTVR